MSKLKCGTDRTEIYRLLEALQQAIMKNDTNAIEELKRQIQEYREVCGSPLTNQDITYWFGINTLEPTERQFINEAPQLVLRSLTNGNLREAITHFARFRSYITPKVHTMPEGFRATIEKIAGKPITRDRKKSTDFQDILGKNFRPDTPDHHARATRYTPKNVTAFLPRTRRLRQTTNTEVSEKVKKAKEKKKDE